MSAGTGEGGHALAERSRLIRIMDDYLAAFAARAPGRLPLAPGLRSTEDTQPLPLGSGLWRTVRALHAGGQYFVDPLGGQVEFWGVIDELGNPAIISIRLRIEGRLIAEVETLSTRAGEYFDPESILADASDRFHALLDPLERASREELIGLAGGYFDAIERSDGSIVAVSDACRRLVNGTLDSMDDPRELDQSTGYRALGVVQQITEGHYAYIEAIRARRYPIVDTLRGIVIAHVLFDHPGDRPRAGGSLPFSSPNSMMFTEAFKVARGCITEIWALGTRLLPYGIACGW
jgi:hypothetical protein